MSNKRSGVSFRCTCRSLLSIGLQMFFETTSQLQTCKHGFTTHNRTCARDPVADGPVMEEHRIRKHVGHVHHFARVLTGQWIVDGATRDNVTCNDANALRCEHQATFTMDIAHSVVACCPDRRTTCICETNGSCRSDGPETVVFRVQIAAIGPYRRCALVRSTIHPRMATREGVIVEACSPGPVTWVVTLMSF